MSSYEEVMQTVRECADKLHKIGNNQKLSDLHKSYKDAENETDRAKMGDIYTVREFYEKFTKESENIIKFEINQSGFNNYIEFVKKSMSRL